MASPLTHLSIAGLGLLFPGNFGLLALLASSNFPDIEYFFISLKLLLKGKNVMLTYTASKTSYLHSLAGSIFLAIPLCMLIVFLASKALGHDFNFIVNLVSVAIGTFSHLILDIPSHKELFLLWPFKVYHKNPFLVFRKPLKMFTKLYKIGVETPSREFLSAHIGCWNWLIFSHAFFIFVVFVYIWYH